MTVLKAIGELVGQVIGKIIALSATAAISALALTLQTNPNIGIVGLTVIVSAVIWQKGIVPVIDEIVASVLPKPTAGTKEPTTKVSTFINII